MKKEIIALIILVLMIAASIFNYRYIEGITNDVLSLVEQSYDQGKSGNWDEAYRLGEEAAKLWTSYDGYTHIFLRHSEIVDADGVLYNYLQQIAAKDLDTARVAADAARSRLEHLVQIEKLKPGSIF